MRATRRVSVPRRADAEAWFAPLPPGMIANLPLRTVSPGCGMRSSSVKTRSMLTEPTTMTRSC